MNKSRFVSLVAEEMEIPIYKAKEAVDGIIDTLSFCLAEGESVQFIGFGTFSVKERKAHKGRNPSTGKSIDIPAKNVVKFKASKSLNSAVALYEGVD